VAFAFMNIHKTTTKEKELRDIRRIERWISRLESWRDNPKDPAKWEPEYNRAMEIYKRHLGYIS